MDSPMPYIESTPEGRRIGYNESGGKYPRTIEIEDTDETLTWYDLAQCNESPLRFPTSELDLMDRGMLKESFIDFTDRVAKYTDPDCRAERNFFKGWRDLCIRASEIEGEWSNFRIEVDDVRGKAVHQFHHGVGPGVVYKDVESGADARLKSSMWYTPCLVPQCYINPYLNKSNPAEDVPERVDFLLRWTGLHEKPGIIEVDGKSHFSDIDSFTSHTQKDRFLRRRGWDVYRFTVKEIDQFEVEHLIRLMNDEYEMSSLIYENPEYENISY